MRVDVNVFPGGPEEFFGFDEPPIPGSTDPRALGILPAMNAALKGPLLLASAMLSFAVMSALVKISGEALPFTEIVFFRSVIGVLVILIWVRRKRLPLMGRRPGLLFLRGMAGTAALFLFFFAITRISVANAMVLNQTTPVFVLPLAALFLKEKITASHVVFVTTALVGVLLVVKPTLEMDRVPSLLALTSALFAAIAYILVRKLTQTEHSLVIVFWFNAVSAVVALPTALPVFTMPSLKMTLALLGMALAATSGQVLMTMAYRLAEAGRLAVIGSLGAVFGAGFDLVIWHHLPDMATAIGGGIIIISCSLLQVRRKRANLPRSWPPPS
jgi:drug/metabolite transporter (DMT)-like permease